MKLQSIWVLVAGLAIGFILGRELPRGGRGGDAAGDKPAVTAKSATAPPGELAASWLQEDVFPKAKELFVGLTPPQRLNVLKLINERKCDCGCPHTVAQCLKDDPNCGTAAGVVASAIALAKQNKTYEQMVAEATKKPAPAAKPSVNQKIALAKWTPVKGPATAKVTMVVFSDFQ
jgi:hypothetical protein